MKVKDLIEQLKECNQELPIFVFDTNNVNIFPVTTVDEMTDRVDINIKGNQYEI